MGNNDLADYMRDITERMQRDYERIQKRAAEDPGTAGDNGEESWAQLLRDWLPQHFHVETKGRIMNEEGECSPQVDVLVLSPSYPKALLKKKEFLAGGVLAAFECKLTLKAKHIVKTVENAATIQRLLPARHGTPYRELHNRIVYGLISHSHVWKGKNSTPFVNIERRLAAAHDKHTTHPREAIDFVVVSDLASWTVFKLLLPAGLFAPPPDGPYDRIDPVSRAKILDAGGAVAVSHMGESEPEQHAVFTPIGAFMCQLLKRFAWEVPEIRPLAEYLHTARPSHAGRGLLQFWPRTVLSTDVLADLKEGSLSPPVPLWNEWSWAFN